MKILCTLPNASGSISGVTFTATPDGMLSDDIADDVAAVFLSIPGYSLPPAEVTKPTVPVVETVKPTDSAVETVKPTTEPSGTHDDMAALAARAAAIGFKIKATWGYLRLKSEVEAAESDAKSDKAPAA